MPRSILELEESVLFEISIDEDGINACATESVIRDHQGEHIVPCYGMKVLQSSIKTDYNIVYRPP